MSERVRGEKEKKRNLMKHRLASLGPMGRLWPSFLILLFFSFFLWRSKHCPSLSFLLSSRYSVASLEERLSPKLGWEGVGVEGGTGRRVCVYRLMCVGIQRP